MAYEALISSPPPNADVKVFSFTGDDSWQQWVKPDGKTWVYALCIGGGSGGSSGGSDTAVGGAGGYPGCSGDQTSVMMPLRFVPNTMWVRVGKGGLGGNSTTAGAGSGLFSTGGGASVIAMTPGFDGTLTSASHSSQTWTAVIPSDSRVSAAGQALLMQGESSRSLANTINNIWSTATSTTTGFTIATGAANHLLGTYSASGTVVYKLLYDSFLSACGGFSNPGGSVADGSGQALAGIVAPAASRILSHGFKPRSLGSSAGAGANGSQDGSAVLRSALGFNSTGGGGGAFLGTGAAGAFGAAGGFFEQFPWESQPYPVSGDGPSGSFFSSPLFGIVSRGGAGGPTVAGVGQRGGDGGLGSGGGGGGGSDGSNPSGAGGNGGDGYVIIMCW